MSTVRVSDFLTGSNCSSGGTRSSLTCRLGEGGADFVQEQGASVGLFELPILLPVAPVKEPAT
ncbi:MAG: hypothetical protein R3B96_11485 [Pirellulaceae bacterium]